MAYEIERKFLVRDESWRVSAGKPVPIRQVYLARNGALSLRIRIKDESSATLTVKSAGAEIRRLEFEYEIPLADANSMFDLREGEIVAKLRHELPWHGLLWEIDVFQGENQGLVIAEIELPDENKHFERPPWLDQEITADPRYSNAGLAMRPFGTW
jgi:adenylate cyclase